ncbi:MAG: HU family DNA-binding protein [Rickettsiales bacterium]|nr:HU family DNA-binding protein [Rickettsiales bacterium]
MTKSELVKILSEKHPQLQLREASELVDLFFNMLTNTLKSNGRIELRGFGTFSLRKRSARLARNPRTGDKVQIGERNVVYFRAGKGLKDRVNASK